MKGLSSGHEGGEPRGGRAGGRGPSWELEQSVFLSLQLFSRVKQSRHRQRTPRSLRGPSAHSLAREKAVLRPSPLEGSMGGIVSK